MNDDPTILCEPGVSGALFGAVAAEQVRRDPDGRDYLPHNPPIDVTDYMSSAAQAGYAALGDAGVWVLTAAGRLRAAEYAAAALHAPGYLHLRASWAGMSGALFRLARGQEPTTDQLAAIPDAHRVYLLGHAARGRELAGMYAWHARLRELVAGLATTPDVPDVPGVTRLSWAAYRVLEFLRGESPEEPDPMPAVTPDSELVAATN